jgi:DNA-binding response OmpR family regulator
MDKRPKILLVDDDADFLEATKGILISKSWNVITAPNGAKGIAMARTDKPDLVLLDMMMPEQDGFLTAREFKADPLLSKTPVLALTSFSVQLGSPFDIEVDEYLQKSISPDELLGRVQAHLKRAGF